MLWAALAFAAGISAGVHMWRPPIWWTISIVALIAAGCFFVRRRIALSLALGFCMLFFMGAFAIQLQEQQMSSVPNAARFADGRELEVTAHVIKEGTLRDSSSNGLSQTIDLLSENVRENEVPKGRLSASDPSANATPVGIRLSIYSKRKVEDAMRPFYYGKRLRVHTKLYLPRNYRNPGAFDYAGYLSENGISALGSAKIDDVSVLPGFTGRLAELWRTRMHRKIIERVHTLWNPSDASLMDAMVIGEDSLLHRAMRMNFQKSGTYHVLVVSGMNVSILAFVTFWFLKRLRVGDIIASAITVTFMVAYALLTDLGSPVWRATLMLAIYLGARLLYREKSMVNAIGAAALGIMSFDPRTLFGASFQLTFLSVWLVAGVGIPLLERTTQPYSKGLRNLDALTYDSSLAPRVAQFRLDLRMIAGRLSRFFGSRIARLSIVGAIRVAIGSVDVLLISAVMQAGLALPMAYYFHRTTVVGLPANLLVVPLMELLMPAAVLALFVSYISPALAKIPAWIAMLAIRGIAGTVHWLGGVRVADARVATPEWPMILMGGVALASALYLMRRRALLAYASLTILAGTAFWISAVSPRDRTHPSVLELTAIDVGQGDAILLVFPRGLTMLVDAGGLPYWTNSELDIGEDVVSPYLWSRKIHSLDVVAITHAHSDHIGGMGAILANFHPQEVWLGVNSSSPELQKLLDQAKTLHIPVISHKAGDILEFGGASIRILAPPSSTETNSSHRNDESLVMKVSYGATSALLEGDAEKQTERQVAEEFPQADLLKVAHHGSATSTIPELLAVVKPKFAVISVGSRNLYGHPRMEVLSRLQESKVATYRTDFSGATTFYLDGKTVTRPDQQRPPP
ncbi:MAG: ComEC/Rec2 family competence protein [Acidobacteriota bacterium]|nr:ComEC/Rec2 family competence protein [Acidobacteriota bacterium]